MPIFQTARCVSSTGAGSRTTTLKTTWERDPYFKTPWPGKAKFASPCTLFVPDLIMIKIFSTYMHIHTFSCIFMLLRFPESNLLNLLWKFTMTWYYYSFMKWQNTETCCELSSSLRKDKGLMNYFFCDVLKTLSSVKTYHYNAWYPIKKKKAQNTHRAIL